jgi:hypothetical protein
VSFDKAVGMVSSIEVLISLDGDLLASVIKLPFDLRVDFERIC